MTDSQLQPGDPLPPPTTPPVSQVGPPTATAADNKPKGPHPAVLIVAGIGVFTICSLVQAAAGTTMFETSAPKPDNTVMEVLVQVTWWPGWIVSIMLVVAGASEWWKRRQQA